MRSSGDGIRRRGPCRPPKTRIIVVCEGRVTERNYLRAFQHCARNPRVHLEVAKETGVPLTVVQCAIRLRAEARAEAKKQRDENLLWDEVWGVVDVDDHPRLDEALALADSEDIQLAVSNPSFELWALLHFQDQRAFVSRQEARAVLRGHLPGYDKDLDFKVMHPAYEDAVLRARDLDREAELHEARGRNPSTGVYRLTHAILTSS